MKEIKAIIRTFKLDDVITALHKIDGLPGLTISEIKGSVNPKLKAPRMQSEKVCIFILRE